MFPIFAILDNVCFSAIDSMLQCAIMLFYYIKVENLEILLTPKSLSINK